MPHKFKVAESLLEPPVRRAAYSDRMAWLMAVMSDLAYVRFEEPTPLEGLAKSLLKEKQERKILAKLTALLAAQTSDQALQELESDLGHLGFKLVRTYNISIPLVVDTQAFLAKLDLSNRDPILVLAFRGTEPTKAADIKSDIRAEPQKVGPDDESHMVHKGF